MRLALVQSFLPSRSQGGVGHFTHQFANHLMRRGAEVTVFSLDPPPEDALYRVVTPKPAELLVRGKLGAIYGFALWLARQDFSSYHLIHAQGDNQFLRAPCPVVRTISGSALSEGIHARRLLTRLMYLTIYPLELVGVARANRAVGISAASLTHFPWIKTVIPQGIDVTMFCPKGPKSASPSVLFVGHQLHDRKRADLLLSEFQHHVRPALPTAELWLVCNDAVNLPGVRCFSNLSLHELAALYQRAWVFCLPSSYEGFGRPYAEAMACGTPVVATPNPGALEVLEGGKFGLITDPAALGPCLVALLGDEGRRAALAGAALRRAQDFSWDKVVAQYEAIYRELLG